MLSFLAKCCCSRHFIHARARGELRGVLPVAENEASAARSLGFSVIDENEVQCSPQPLVLILSSSVFILASFVLLLTPYPLDAIDWTPQSERGDALFHAPLRAEALQQCAEGKLDF